ncbi:glycerol-3-phosphate dehydrogenase/oxidase [Arthrobacter sp. H14]|uniref:glycerol-3-phosphate dehydrogenase/oxidase n=1 Tax=Arthrobacter sp. H14 TaxID=1312959 RepID=UPI00047940C5
MGSNESAVTAFESGPTAYTREAVEGLKSRPTARVLIIGGGINGVGTFRDLALQGVDVALVERGDYCAGASGASSHMIHGGIRYLENGEFRLVKESVQERNGLLQTAPHYVKPLKTTIPIYSTFSGILSAPLRFLTHRQGKPTERGALLIKLGLSIYDAFSRGGGMVPRHQFAGKARALKELPQLNPGIKYAATYFDASVHNPERLTLDVLRDGESANMHARASNYVNVVSSGSDGVELRDELTGETFSFAADVVINTTGAGVDQTNAVLGSPSQFMGGTKGSHIVLDHPELLDACSGRELFFEHTDGRIVLIYPIGNRVLVGTTDIDAGDPGQVVCTDEEIDYFFDLIGHVFPSVPVSRDDIVYSFSGVRPLPRHDDTQPGFVSRDYRIERRDVEGPDGTVTTLSLVGGKWTTFRALAEHITNDALALLDRTRKVSTAGLPIGGGRDFPSTTTDAEAWVQGHTAPSVPAERVRVLLERYGTRAAEVIEFLQTVQDQAFHSTDELSTGEVLYMVEHEQVGHLTDVLIRRTSLAFRGLVTAELLHELAAVLASALHWDNTRRNYEVEYAQRVLSQTHGIHVQSLIA